MVHKKTTATAGEQKREQGRYLLGTADKGMFIKPDPKKSFEVYVDTDF